MKLGLPHRAQVSEIPRDNVGGGGNSHKSTTPPLPCTTTIHHHKTTTEVRGFLQVNAPPQNHFRIRIRMVRSGIPHKKMCPRRTRLSPMPSRRVKVVDIDNMYAVH